MARCPLCRARLAGAATCPRCGADLASLQAVGSQADGYLNQALACLITGDRQRAAVYTQQALRLRRTPLAEAVADWLRASERPDTCRTEQDVPARHAAVQQTQPQPMGERTPGDEQLVKKKPKNPNRQRARTIQRLVKLFSHKR